MKRLGLFLGEGERVGVVPVGCFSRADKTVFLLVLLSPPVLLQVAQAFIAFGLPSFWSLEPRPGLMTPPLPSTVYFHFTFSVNVCCPCRFSHCCLTRLYGWEGVDGQLYILPEPSGLLVTDCTSHHELSFYHQNFRTSFNTHARAHG